MVAGEMTLAVILALGAALLVRSFIAVLAVDPGFQPQHVLTMQLQLPERLTTAPARVAFYRELFDRLEHVPGVVAVGGTTRLPLGSGSVTTALAVEGRPPEPGPPREVEFRRALHDFFPAMGIPVVRGRGFLPSDGADGAERVVVINRALARAFWQDADPVGQRVRMGTGASAPWFRVIGVIGDIRHAALDTAPAPEIYITYLQNPPVTPFVAIRTSGDAAAMAARVRAAVRELDANVPLYDVRTMDEVRSASVAERRFIVVLATAFGLISVLLATIGVYGVTALAVSERRQEVGVRLALGATPSRMLVSILRSGTSVAVAGCAAGFAAFVMLSPVLDHYIYGVARLDPVAIGVVPALLLGVAILACLVPATRVLQIEPAAAIRGS